MSRRQWFLALGGATVIADVSVVTLALPQLLVQLHTSVTGVAAVLAVYTLALAGGAALLATLPAQRSSRSAGAIGYAVFALGAVLCAAASTVTVLLVGRAVQAAGGALALTATFTLLDAPDAGRRRWLGVAVLASAAGPAAGGLLTEAFDWRAIFVLQVPIALLAALASGRAAEPTPPARTPIVEHSPPPVTGAGRAGYWRLRAALALLSAALSAVLFLLVLLLVSGWEVSPLEAAAAVSVVPLSALCASLIRTDPHGRAVLGCVLLAGGLLALAWVPQPTLAWTILPQVLGGAGMGLALPALAGELLPERTARQAAGLLAVRHAGIAVILAALAPLLAHQLDASIHTAKLQGVAEVIDSPLAPAKKLELAPEVLGAVRVAAPRTSLRGALRAARPQFSGSERAAFDSVSATADATLVAAFSNAFRFAFVIAAALAALAAALLLTRAGISGALLSAIALVAIALPAAYAYEQRRLAPSLPVVTTACEHAGARGGGSGLEEVLQGAALGLIEHDACRLHISREELILVLGDGAERRRFTRAHGGVDPGSLGGILEGLLP